MSIYRPVFAKYRLLRLGQSHSGKILLSLPVRNASPVYYFTKPRTELRRTTLNRAVFEVGYLKGEVVDRAIEIMRLVRLDDPNAKKSDNMPEVKEEMLGGESRKFAIVPYTWQEIDKEKSATLVITDVEIPCLE